MAQDISFAIYGYRGPERLRCLLNSIRYLCHNHEIVVAEDRSDDATAEQYDRVCGQFGARHIRTPVHVHMSGANQAAVMACTTPWVLVCSDDVMMPRGLVPSLEQFISDNFLHDHEAGVQITNYESGRQYGRSPRTHEFLHRIAGVFLHHWDRRDIIEMSRRGDIPELPDFQERDFFAGGGEWFWKHLDGKLPYGGWSEPAPPDKVACCPAVHGSAFVANRSWWEKVGGTANIDCWQNDSVFSARVANFSDAHIVRLPWLPSLAHFGGAAEFPPDPSDRWKSTVDKLCMEHGFALVCGLPNLLYGDGAVVPPIAILELGWRARALARQRRYADAIDNIDYSYRDFVDL